MRNLSSLACLLLLAAACHAPSPSLSSGYPETCTPGATEACYSGAAATEGVGACHAGVRTCAADGSGYGACTGEVVPQVESCASIEDVSCDGQLAACTGSKVWKLPIQGTVEPAGIAASPDGEVTVFGWAQTIDLGTGPQGDPSAWSLFVARVGAGGLPRWLRTFPGVDPSKHAGGVVMNAAHEATIAFYVEGSVTIDGQTFDAPVGDVLALQLADDGTLTEARLLDLGVASALPPLVQVARLAPDDSVVVAGAGFVAQLEPGLAIRWVRRYVGDVTFADVTFDAAGRVLAGGAYTGAFDPGGGATAVTGFHAGFLAEIDAGSTVWSQTVGDVETSVTSLVSGPGDWISFGGSQAEGGSIVGGTPSGGWTGFIAARYDSGLISGSIFGWGPRVPRMTLDASGDTVTVAQSLSTNTWQGTIVFKSSMPGRGTSYWTQILMWTPSVTFTLPTGETFIAAPQGVQELGR